MDFFGFISGLTFEQCVKYFFAPIPSLLMLYQLLYLYFRRSRQTGFIPRLSFQSRGSAGGSEQTSTPSDGDESPLDLLKKRRNSYFSFGTLAMDFLIPAVAFYIAALAGLAFLSSWASRVDTTFLVTSKPATSPATLPATIRQPITHNLGYYVWFGAYIAALQVLVFRVARRDISPGVSYRTVVNFVMGIVMGALLLVALPAEVLTTTSRPAESSVSPVLIGIAVCFAAGFAPQNIVSFFMTISDRFLGARVAAPAPRNDVPLSFVNGITPEIEVRLADEGITNIANLAFADPVALIKNTVFSRNQIINWMDQALLMDVLSENWPSLRRHGISGAIDLAAVYLQEDRLLTELAEKHQIDKKLLKTIAEKAVKDTTLDAILDKVVEKYGGKKDMLREFVEQLAKSKEPFSPMMSLSVECKIQYEILMSVAQRLDEDQQVNILRALYKDPVKPGLAPILRSPGSETPPGPTIADLVPTMAWHAVPGATSYSLEIKHYPFGLKNVAYFVKDLTEESHQVAKDKLKGGVEYRWAMTSFVGTTPSKPSTELYFKTPSGADGTTAPAPGPKTL